MVKWSDHALAQLLDIHDYIAKNSRVYAKTVSRTLVQKSLPLDELPRLGKIVPELNEDAIRELSVYSYRLMYEINSNYIEVLAIIHKRRDIQADDIL
jgi:toxin ParE1/3/4